MAAALQYVMNEFTLKKLQARGERINPGAKIVAPDDVTSIVRGRYGNIIDVISDDKGHFNPMTIKVNQSTPLEVVEFVRSFMLTPVVPLAPDAVSPDDDVFNKIIPRHVGDASALGGYIDYVIDKKANV